MAATVEYVESPCRFGIVVGEELMRPFHTRRAAELSLRKGWARDAVVRPIKWVKDERYTCGARAIIVEEEPIRPELEAIAREKLGVVTLEVRNRDRLDFYDLGVSAVRAALEAAFEAGRRDERAAVDGFHAKE